MSFTQGITRLIRGKEEFNVTKLTVSIYRNVIQKVDDEIVYCEIQCRCDRSSFAGAALKITNEKGKIIVRQCEEKIIQNVSKYEKIYIGYEQDYIDCIRKFFSLEKREYGIELFFLVYSDVRSSQIAFEKLMKNLNKNVDIIGGQL